MEESFEPTFNRPFMLYGRPTPGVSVDKLDVAAGLKMLTDVCGYTDAKTIMVIEYALLRHAKGEELAAERGAIDRSFHGIDFTSWRMVLAAAMAAAYDQPTTKESEMK